MSLKCVVMGVCGSGKTSVAKALADHFNATFIDGDDLHPRRNILKMMNGVPLEDEDRFPWLERINDVFFSMENRTTSGIVVCSALKKKYRDFIRKNNKSIIFIHLYGSKEIILKRVSSRKGHFMHKEMISSQFECLEFPYDEPDVININIDNSLEYIVSQAISQIEKRIVG